MKLPPPGSTEYKQLEEYVCLLRYRTKDPSAKSPTYLRLPAISSIIGCSTTSIRSICLRRINSLSPSSSLVQLRAKSRLNLTLTKKDRRRKVTLAFKKLAQSEKMLKSMVGRSLNERCVLLHREMPDIKIKR